MTIHFQGKHKSGYTVDTPQAFTFPAGEAHIKDLDKLNLDDYHYLTADVRGHDPQDLFHLALWAQGIRDLSTSPPPLYVLLSYLPAARADRGTPDGAYTYSDFLLNIVAPDRIFGLDPHSPVMPNYLAKVFSEVPFERIIKRDIAHPRGDQFQMDHPYTGVIAPDAGARERAKRAASVLHVPVYTAGKTRNFETGELTGFHMEDTLPSHGSFLLVDDICDGGGTFLGLAEAIKETNPHVVLDLWVTHGVFSKGLSDLAHTFRRVHTTNSYFPGGTTFFPSGVSGTHVVPKNVFTHDITSYMYAEATNFHNLKD